MADTACRTPPVGHRLAPQRGLWYDNSWVMKSPNRRKAESFPAAVSIAVGRVLRTHPRVGFLLSGNPHRGSRPALFAVSAADNGGSRGRKLSNDLCPRSPGVDAANASSRCWANDLGSSISACRISSTNTIGCDMSQVAISFSSTDRDVWRSMQYVDAPAARSAGNRASSSSMHSKRGKSSILASLEIDREFASHFRSA